MGQSDRVTRGISTSRIAFRVTTSSEEAAVMGLATITAPITGCLSVSVPSGYRVDTHLALRNSVGNSSNGDTDYELRLANGRITGVKHSTAARKRDLRETASSRGTPTRTCVS